ncbi:hypothetical protein FRC04_008468 [Tulasnella sp. 424]|nr:hypothetical protein FRC04_008468 [Tulasnella sp. 424]
MSENASYDYEALQKALASALTSLEPLRISRDRLTVLPGRRFSGGYGVVVKANLKGQGSQLSTRTVAIKKLRMAEDDDLRTTIRLVREMKLWAELKHPNIVPFIGFHIGEEVAWLISDWAPNGNVQDFLTERKVDSATRLGIVVDVASGLVYLHGLDPPICHGDLKPGNILINHEIRGMLADFGLSRALQANSTGLTTSKTIKGSLRYMSPELLMQDASHTLASDVWAFGCVALEVEYLLCAVVHEDAELTVLDTITSTPPFDEYQGEPQILLQLVQGTPPALLRDQSANDVDPELQKLLNRCWNMSPENRPAMEECLIAFRQPRDFELVTGEGWSAHFDAKVFPEFDLECLQTNVTHGWINLVLDGERYLFQDSLNILHTVDVRTNTEVFATTEPCITFSFELQYRYFTLHQSRDFIVWDFASNRIISRVPIPPHITSPDNRGRGTKSCISGDGHILIVADNAKSTLYIWNILSGSLRSLPLAVRETGTRQPETSFDGRYAGLSEVGRGVEIYNTQTLQFVTDLQVDYLRDNLVMWTTHGNKVVVGTNEWVKVWDMDAYEERSKETFSSQFKASPATSEGDAPCCMTFSHPEQVTEIHISRDDALLVTICGGKRVTVWDIYLGTYHLVINLTQSNFRAIYVSPIPSEEQERYALMLRFGKNIWRTELTRKKANAAEVIEDSRTESPDP